MNEFDSTTVRDRADKVKDFRCKNVIAVIENPMDIKNIGTVIRLSLIHI